MLAWHSLTHFRHTNLYDPKSDSSASFRCGWFCGFSGVWGFFGGEEGGFGLVFCLFGFWVILGAWVVKSKE